MRMTCIVLCMMVMMVDCCGPRCEYGIVVCRLICKPLLGSRHIHKAQSEPLKVAVVP